MRSTWLPKNLKHIRLITFDVTDTLLRFRTPPAEQYTITGRKYGYAQLSSAEIATSFRKQFKAMATEYPNFGRNSILQWNGWWKELVSRTLLAAEPKMQLHHIDAIADELIELYRGPAGWSKHKVANEIIQKLKDNGKIVGVISNFDPRLSEILANVGIAEVDFILTSYETGVEKPDKRIFDLALDASNLPEITAGGALHIGNSPVQDYKGARSAGWSCFLINNKPSDLLAHDFVNVDHTFEDLDRLLVTLESQQMNWS